MTDISTNDTTVLKRVASRIATIIAQTPQWKLHAKRQKGRREGLKAALYIIEEELERDNER